MTIGARLTEVLKERKMSQGELAARMGVSRQAVNMWLNDKVDMPLKNVIQLCENLELSADWLLTGKGQSVVMESMLNTKDMQIHFLQMALDKAEAKIDDLNQRIGGLKTTGIEPRKERAYPKYHKQ